MNLHPGPEKRRALPESHAEVLPVELAFHENQEWYEDLAEHSQDLLWIHDLSGRLLSVNATPSRVLGYSMDEILQIPLRDLVAPESQAQFDEYMKTIASARQASGFLAVLARSGERRIWEYHNTLVEGKGATVVRGIARDVTEQRRTERLLREANEKLLHRVDASERIIRELKLFRALVDRSNDSIQVVDPHTLGFLDANERACSQLGYSYEELLALKVFDVDPEATEASAAKISEKLKRTGFVTMESVHLRKNGTTFPVELRITLVRLDRDYALLIARDLTQSKRDEEKLREYERVVEGLEEMIAVVDRDYRYVVANRAFLNYRRLRGEQVIGHTVSEIVGKEVFESKVRQRMDECFAGKVVEYELVYDFPKLGRRNLFASYFPIEGSQGVDRLAMVVRDVTDRRQAEEALRATERQQRELARQLETERTRLIEAQAVAKVGSWEVELSSFDVTWSDQTHSIFETDPSHFQPTRPAFVERIHPEDRKKVDAAFEASLEKCAPSTVEYRIVMPDGRVKVLEEHWRIFQTAPGQRPVRLMGTCRDITEQKKGEEALRRSEENYRNFVSQSSEGIFQEEMATPAAADLPEDELVHRILHDAYIADCNDAMAGMYGLTSGDELRGKLWKELAPPEDPKNIEMTREFVRSGFRLLEHESHERDVHGNPKIFLNSMIGTVEDGMLLRTWGIQRDITEKVRSEAAQGLAEESLRQHVVQLRQVTEELRLAKEKLAEEKLYLEEAIDTELGFGEIVGNSTGLKGVMDKVARVAPSDATVLLLGETGSGKELVARALHRLSKRLGNSFIKLNCAAIPSGLLESELFGHEKGAFTGAVARKLGRLELADKGTLFLDEIGEIPLSLQPKLLRVLQDQEFERLGGTQTIKVDFRLLAATNRDLMQSVKEREFRSDLYYRLNVFPILLPPLRERRGDIRPLVEHFVRKFAAKMKKSITSIPAKTMELLVRWDWPGNIRELENFVERSVILTPGSVLQSPLSELEPDIYSGNGDTLSSKDRERIVCMLRECHGKLGGAGGAAARLGLKRTTLQSKLDHLGIKPSTYRL